MYYLYEPEPLNGLMKEEIGVSRFLLIKVFFTFIPSYSHLETTKSKGGFISLMTIW